MVGLLDVALVVDSLPVVVPNKGVVQGGVAGIKVTER